MTSCWVNADIVWDVHMVTLRIGDDFLRPSFQAMGAKRDDESQEATAMEPIIRAILAVAQGDKYAEAQFYRLQAPWPESGWYVTILHPLLPACSPQREPDILDVSFAPGGQQVVLQAIGQARREMLTMDDMDTAVSAIVGYARGDHG